MPRLLRKTLALVTVTAALSLVAVTPAHAHAIKAAGTLYKSADLCTRARSSMTHRSPDAYGGWIAAITYSYTRNIGSPVVYCSVPWIRPGLNIRSNLNWWVWASNGSTFSWAICRQSGWIYNRYSAVSLQWDIRYATPPCGSAWYLAHTLHGVANSGWYGGELAVPDSHWYPDYTQSTATEEPTVPATLPTRAPLAGPDGRVQLGANGAPIMVDAVPPDTMVDATAEHSTYTDAEGVHEIAVINQ
jgi:hypothetical protein